MTKEERDYLENLEECFEQLKSVYADARVEIDELNSYLEVLKNLCRQNSIEPPDFKESSLF